MSCSLPEVCGIIFVVPLDSFGKKFQGGAPNFVSAGAFYIMARIFSSVPDISVSGVQNNVTVVVVPDVSELVSHHFALLEEAIARRVAGKLSSVITFDESICPHCHQPLPPVGSADI